MEFPVPCDCGKTVMVFEGRAGLDITCACGRTFKAPSLKELRVKAGLPPFHVSPEVMIPHMLVNGELPGTKKCAKCGVETVELVRVIAECERKFFRKGGGFNWPLFFVTAIFSPLVFFRWEHRTVEELGRDKTLLLPLAICSRCRGWLRGRWRIKETLKTVPIYRELLDKFPKAKVTIRRI